MSKVINRMNGEEVSLPCYHVKSLPNGEVITCLKDDKDAAEEWLTFTELDGDMMCVVMKKVQAKRLVEILQDSNIRNIKLIRDIRRSLLSSMGEDVFEGDDE